MLMYFSNLTLTVDVSIIEALIVEREQARHDNDWAEADRIRQVLADMSIVIEDGAGGTTWKIVKKSECRHARKPSF